MAQMSIKYLVCECDDLDCGIIANICKLNATVLLINLKDAYMRNMS